MATAALVSNDIYIGRRIVAALTRASIPVSVYLWAFIPQLQEWQFFVATPLVDTKGPLAAYGEVNKALQKEGLFAEIPLRRIFLRSPSDRILRSLEKESKVVPHEAFRVVNAQIAGNFVEDAYVYSGSIDVMQEEPRGGGIHQYLLIYTPYSGPGGAVPTVRLQGGDQLREFLEHKVGVRREVVESAVKELMEKGDVVIPNVQLKRSELRRLELAK